MSPPPPRVGSTAWEQAGGPALTLGQRAATLLGASRVIASHVRGWVAWRWHRQGWGRGLAPPVAELAGWAPPDSRAVADADAFVREVSTPELVRHCLRSYYFAAALYELSAEKPPLDREALYVGTILHDVGLGKDLSRPGEHCFTVSSAREARRIAGAAGWDQARQDRMALVVTSNLNPAVSVEEFGAESHFMSLGGRIEVLAQEWLLNPATIAEVLGRYPRDGFIDDVMPHIDREMARNPRSRFACLNPVFPLLVRHSHFSIEATR